MKLILKSIAVLFVTTILLSSCLGDGSGTTIKETLPCYIKASSSMSKPYAISRSLAFTSDLVNTLTPGRFYYISYEVSTKDGQDAEGVFNAAHTSLTQDAPVARGGWNSVVAVDPIVPVDKRMYPLKESIGTVFFSYGSELSDKWIFKYTCFAHDVDTQKDALASSLTFGENNLRLVATVVEVNQVSLTNGDDLPYNQVVVNLHLEKKQVLDIPQGSELKSHPGEAVVDLSGLREYLRSKDGFPEEIATNEDFKKATAAIQFRYKATNDKEGNDIADAVLGNLDDNPKYFMLVVR